MAPSTPASSVAGVLVVLVLMTTTTTTVTADATPRVQLEKGALRGLTMSSQGGRSFLAFRGIPYARPPVGKYRFREPKPAKPWQGVWDATRLPAKCLQFDRYPESALDGDEDCLYLNVYTPRLTSQAGQPLLDVLVWIHGGGFMYGGSADWGPEILMDHDVVLVTINYRVGPLGFLSTEDEVVPGNNGLKDQALALRWVQGNIAAFGGNPNSVTLFGLSAGGASVHYHYLSPLSEGLFHRGWSLSGSALCPWTQQESARAKAAQLAALLGCPTNTSRELVECLRHRPARAVVGAVPGLQDDLELPFSPFAPVVEPTSAAGSAATPSTASSSRASGAFLPHSPIDTIRAGLAHDLPWITGVTTEEGLYNAAEFLGESQASRLEDLDSNWLRRAPLLLDYNYTVDAARRDEVSRTVREHYLGQRTLSAETRGDFTRMIGDRIFKTCVEQAAREMARANTQPVYLYEFGFRGESSISSYMALGDTTNWGVSHADDAGYVFKWSIMPTGQTPEERRAAKHLQSLWTTFAKTGVPSALPGSPGWSPLDTSATDLHMLRFEKDGELSFSTVPQLGMSTFWNSLPIKENVPSTPTPRDEL